MSITAKAIVATVLLALAPAAASAQGYTTGPVIVGGVTTHGPFDGGANPNYGGTPVQASGCGAAYAQFLVGQNIHTIPVPGHVRVIGPDTVVTFDYRPDRLNLNHDYTGTITRVYCG